jgi:hypothetical protein
MGLPQVPPWPLQTWSRNGQWRSTNLHTHMSALWQMQETPQWMKGKRLKLSLKVPGNLQIKNMRPISLYKVIRKVLTTAIAKIIHRVLHEAEVLHGLQSEYRLDQGIMMSLLQVINQIERAIHSDTSKHITFWDIRRAFDYIPQKPPEASMDANGSVQESG